MNTPRRLTTVTRRLTTALRVALRRRPRTVFAAGLLIVIVALVGSGGLALISTAPPPTASTAPAFTVRDGWTLADLERHIEAGAVDAITAVPTTGANPGAQRATPRSSGLATLGGRFVHSDDAAT
ncbi:MAG TPA: hypothetical protein VHM48_12185 [Candidatus Limnocylindrales bacterium]|nr:hypothetical protein [Candidatus Limnocylindrales bacterium]